MYPNRLMRLEWTHIHQPSHRAHSITKKEKPKNPAYQLARPPSYSLGWNTPVPKPKLPPPTSFPTATPQLNRLVCYSVGRVLVRPRRRLLSLLVTVLLAVLGSRYSVGVLVCALMNWTASIPLWIATVAQILYAKPKNGTGYLTIYQRQILLYCQNMRYQQSLKVELPGLAALLRSWSHFRWEGAQCFRLFINVLKSSSGKISSQTKTVTR